VAISHHPVSIFIRCPVSLLCRAVFMTPITVATLEFGGDIAFLDTIQPDDVVREIFAVLPVMDASGSHNLTAIQLDASAREAPEVPELDRGRPCYTGYISVFTAKDTREVIRGLSYWRRAESLRIASIGMFLSRKIRR
jgi:hypothetical protein